MELAAKPVHANQQHRLPLPAHVLDLSKLTVWHAVQDRDGARARLSH